jgi:cell division protein FtsB
VSFVEQHGKYGNIIAMKELQRKQKFRRALYSVPSLILLLIIAALIARGAYRVFTKERESAHRVADLKDKINVLSSRETELEADIARLGTDEGKIEEIKRKFNVAAEGEHVAVVVDPRGKAATTTPVKTPWYKRIRDAIIGR